jgi:hypothetical protein
LLGLGLSIPARYVARIEFAKSARVALAEYHLDFVVLLLDSSPIFDIAVEMYPGT